MRVLPVLTVLFALACADDDKPTAPTPEPDPAAQLIGTWRYTGNDFHAIVAANLKEYLIGQGLTASQTDMVVSDLLGKTNELFSLALKLVFRADGTVILDDGPPDRFQVTGNRITITASYGGTSSLEYAVTDTTLTLHFPVPPLLATEGLEAEDEEEAELLRAMLKGIEILTMYFSR